MSKIRPAFRCSEIIKEKFSTSQCLLTVSVGQETHENDRLALTLDLIGRSFASCTLALHDSLQRHTIALGECNEAENFRALAVSLGDAWLKRNAQHIAALKIPLKIIRWEQWIGEVEFYKAKESILQELNRCVEYRAVFDGVIKDYLARYVRRQKHPELFDVKRGQKLCMDYLVEECAVLCLWPKTACEFEVYAGKHNVAMVETQKRFVSNSQLQSIGIVFSRRPNLQPQNFNY